MVTLREFSSQLVLVPFYCSKDAVYRIFHAIPYAGTFSWVSKPTSYRNGVAYIRGSREVIYEKRIRAEGDFLDQGVSRLSPDAQQIDFLVWDKDKTFLKSGKSEQQVSNSQVVGDVVAFDCTRSIYSVLMGVRDPSGPYPYNRTETGALSSPYIRRAGTLEVYNPYPYNEGEKTLESTFLDVPNGSFWRKHSLSGQQTYQTFTTRTDRTATEVAVTIREQCLYSGLSRKRSYLETCVLHIPLVLGELKCRAPKRGTTTHDTVYTSLLVTYKREYLDDPEDVEEGTVECRCSVYTGRTAFTGFDELVIPPTDAIRGKTIRYCTWSAESITTVLTSMIGDGGGIGINNIENLASFPTSIFHPKSSVLQFVKKCKYTRPLLVLSDIYLMYQYGLKPSFADIKAIGDFWTSGNFSRSICDQVLYGTWTEKNGATHTIKMRLRLKERALSSVYLKLKDLGLELSAANLWDLVPYSFVVDWVVPVGDWLTALQDYTDLVLNYELMFASVSSSIGEPVSSNLGDLVVKYYDRGYLSQYPVYLPSAGGASGIQVIPGGVLVIQSLLR